MSRLTPSRLTTCALLLVLTLLAACAPQTADGGPQTATPPPTVTPTRTPNPTATFTPTPLPHPSAFDPAFARGLVHFDPAGGHWLVTASYRTADGSLETADFALDPDSFDTHDALRQYNPLAPYTVRAYSPLPSGEGPGVREVTLLWNPDTAEFRVAYSFPTLFEGVGTENPTLIQENLDAIPFIPIEDIQSGLAAQSVLLAMQEQGFQPFSERTDLGEYRLRFELRNNGLRTAELIALRNLDLNLDVNYHPMRVVPFLFKSSINGQERLIFSIAILNPQDRNNWSPDEFIVTFGILQPEIFPQDLVNFFRSGSSHLLINSLYLYATNPNLDPNNPNTIVIPNSQNPDGLPTLLDRRDPFQSLLAQLLAIDGNDAKHLVSRFQNALYFPSAMTYLDDLGNAAKGFGNVIEMPIPPGVILPPELQQMLFLIEVGAAQ